MTNPTPTRTPASRRADHWKPENPWFETLKSELRKELNSSRIQTDFSPEAVAFTNVEHTTAQVFLGAEPHTDMDFDRWFVMMVLQASPDAILHTAPHIKLPKNRKLVSAQDIPMVEGEIFVFDAHRLHWVKSPVDLGQPSPSWRNDSYELWEKNFDKTTVIIGTELRSRPTREAAESRLLEFFSQHTPNCWTRATGLDSVPRPGRDIIRKVKP